MKTLAIDTALQSCSAAVIDDDALLAHQRLDLEKGHAERLAPLVAETLNEAGLCLGNIDRVGVTTGPGGFSGIRVGLSFARGLALGSKVNVMGVNTFVALGVGRDLTQNVAVLIAGPRGQAYGALLRPDLSEIMPPFMDETVQVVKRIENAVSENIHLIAAMRGRDFTYPANWETLGVREQVSTPALARYCATASPANRPPAPLYLREADAVPAKLSAFAGLLS